MNSLIFRTAAPLIVIVMLVFAAFVLLRGHDASGGGFIGGLIAASAVATYGLASGPAAVMRALRVPPQSIAGFGLLVAIASGLVSLAVGAPFLTAQWTFFRVGDAEVGLSTPQLFDIGVFLVVFGTLSAIFMALETEGGER